MSIVLNKLVLCGIMPFMPQHKKAFAEKRVKTTVQLDDPIDRLERPVQRHLQLTNAERTILREERNVSSVLALFLTGMSLVDACKEIECPIEEIIACVESDRYPDLRNAVIDKIISFFLDIDNSHTRKEIRDAVGLTYHQFNKLLEASDFEDRYANYFQNIKTDPVIQAVQTQFVQELLPKAYRVFNDLLTDKGVPATVRFAAAKEVIIRAGVKNVEPEVSERHELAQWLAQNGVQNNTTVNMVVVPKEYAEAVEKYHITEDVVDGEFRQDANLLEP